MKVGIAIGPGTALDVITGVLDRMGGYDVAWVAEDGQSAVQKCADDTPRLVILDISMPVLNGVECTKRIMDNSPCGILIVTDVVQERASEVFEAMRWGALDVAAVPGTLAGPGADELAKKISTLTVLIGTEDKTVAEDKTAKRDGGLPVIIIGASTGGPKALATVLGGFPKDLDAGIVVAQHIDAGFTLGLVEWLNKQTELEVGLAQKGDAIKRACVLVAGDPGDLVVTPGGTLGYVPQDPDTPYHPSINVLFGSCAESTLSPGVAVILSGMGRDGVDGMLKLREAGWWTMAQDEATSTIYGMPKIAAEKKAAMEVMGAEQMPTMIMQRLQHMARRST